MSKKIYKEGLQEIFDHYKLEHQLYKLAEEGVEMSDACFKVLKNKSFEISSQEHLIEEISDVLVLIDQLKLKYPEIMPKIKEYKYKKVKRQLERISKV